MTPKQRSNQSKLAIFLSITAAICIILKLLISYLYPYSRLFLWFVIIPILLICLTIFAIKNRKNLLRKQVILCAVISLVAIVFTFLPIDRQLELARFRVSKGFYNSVAQSVQTDIRTSEDTMSGRYYLKFPKSMLNPVYGCVDYYKKNNHIAIIFPVSQSFSTVRYFVYLSDPKAKDLLENPKKYGSNRTGYNRIEKLDGDHWIYAFYWGEILKKDPNL